MKQIKKQGAPLGVRAAADVAQFRMGEEIPHGSPLSDGSVTNREENAFGGICDWEISVTRRGPG
ncbi:hypothetical protein ACIPWY_31645 [Streptomyces sp. NPDC090032]|uniref:hypothetical protein n=1 Tax=unclassified Streptomyces TaxID=2593676 RepID=UPI00371C0D11